MVSLDSIQANNMKTKEYYDSHPEQHPYVKRELQQYGYRFEHGKYVVTKNGKTNINPMSFNTINEWNGYMHVLSRCIYRMDILGENQ